MARPATRSRLSSGLIPQIANVEAVIVCLVIAFASGGLSKLVVSGGEAVADRMDGSTAFGVTALFIPAYLYSLWVIYKVPYTFLNCVKRVGPLWISIGLCVVSILWSIAPVISGRRVALLLICALFSIALAARLGREGLVRAIGITTIFLVIVQLLSAVIVPALGMPHDKFYPAIPGLFLHKNGAGRMLVLGVVAGLALLHTRPKGIPYLIIALSTVGVLASTSGTGLGAMAVCVLLYVVLISLRGAGLFWLSTVFGVITILIFALSVGTTFIGDDSTYAILGKDATLTGRTSIWAGVWSALQTGERIWYGYGYEAFFASPQGVGSINWNMQSYVPPHAHNGLLQTWLSTGAIGVALLIFNLVVLLVRAANNFSKGADRLSTFDIIFLFYFMLVNVTEQTTLLYNNYVWCILVAVAALPSSTLQGSNRLMTELAERKRRDPGLSGRRQSIGQQTDKRTDFAAFNDE